MTKNEKISAALTGRCLSAEHRAAISASTVGRRQSPAAAAAVADRLKNRHHRRYEWFLINPQNELVRTDRLREFCQLHGLSYSTFRHKAKTGDSLPVRSGPNTGWTVFAVKPAIPLKSQD